MGGFLHCTGLSAAFQIVIGVPSNFPGKALLNAEICAQLRGYDRYEHALTSCGQHICFLLNRLTAALNAQGVFSYKIIYIYTI